jgi:hypothetical protein
MHCVLFLSQVSTHFMFIILYFHFNKQIPHSLYKENGYDHREALFGKPAYGGSIAQNVYYAQQELCDGDVDTTKGVPTRPNDPETNKMQSWPTPFILMVDRGGCTFVKKVNKLVFFKVGSPNPCAVHLTILPFR